MRRCSASASGITAPFGIRFKTLKLWWHLTIYPTKSIGGVSAFAGTLATPRHCSQFHFPKASACALVRPTHERWKRHPHVSHLPVASSCSWHHKRSIPSPFHPPWDKETNCPLPSTKRGLQYSQPGVTVASGEGAGTPACYKKAPPQSGTAPTSGSRQVRQQTNPLTHWRWT